MTVTLSLNGQIYTRWPGVKILRSLKNVCSGFSIITPGELDPPILPFQSCVLMDDGQPIVTGYVDEVVIEVDARGSRTTVTGRSKTQDLIDCMIAKGATNQFNSSTLDAIARAVAGQFGISVVLTNGVNVGGPFADATFEYSETAYRFLERLARQRAVLLTDDPSGNLVLTTLGTAMAPAPLATGKGGNVFRARGKLSGRQRFSQYRIKSQAGMSVTGSTVETQNEGVANDPGVLRYRHWIGVAESALVQSDAQARANWEASHRLGEAVAAILSVPEWTANGQLWQTNQLVKCNVPRLDLNDTLLIGTVQFWENERGRWTEIGVAKPSAYSPEPLAEQDATWANVPKVVGGQGGTPSGAAPSPPSNAL